MKILIIDNYDSFTFNLYQMVGEILENTCKEFKLDVFRNNKITIEKIKKNNYDRIILSPGPGKPDDIEYFGVCEQIIKDLGKEIPVLGVCLGMQGIAYCFGAKIILASKPMHGKTSFIKHNEKGIFKNLPQNLEVMRYHSLIVDNKKIPNCLEITSTVLSGNSKGEIMGLRHKKYPITGIQFHPESFATEGGNKIIKNFLQN